MLLLLQEQVGQKSDIESLDEGRVQEPRGGSSSRGGRSHHGGHVQVTRAGRVQGAVQAWVHHPGFEGRVGQGRYTQGGLKGSHGGGKQAKVGSSGRNKGRSSGEAWGDQGKSLAGQLESTQ